MDAYPICKHTLTGGAQCQSPALKDYVFCYFHERERVRQERLSSNFHRLKNNAEQMEKMRLRDAPDNDLFYALASAETMESLELPIPEDPDAIQVMLGYIIRAVATQQINFRAAKLILHALQVAAFNVHHTSKFSAGVNPAPSNCHSERAAEPRVEETQIAQRTEARAGNDPALTNCHRGASAEEVEGRVEGPKFSQRTEEEVENRTEA